MRGMLSEHPPLHHRAVSLYVHERGGGGLFLYPIQPSLWEAPAALELFLLGSRQIQD